MVTSADIAANVKALRRERKLSQQALADAAGMSRPGIAQLESGRHYPTGRTLAALAAALGVTVGELLGERVA